MTSSPPRGTGASWTVVAPVKAPRDGKSRLRADLATAFPGRSVDVTALVGAMQADCLDAVARCGVVAQLLVVTQQARAPHPAARVVHEPAGPAVDPLNRAIRLALARASGPVVVLLADLPCLRPADLAAALCAVQNALDDGAPAAFVPDSDGSGTVLLAAAEPSSICPRFGRDSARRHALAGAGRLDLDLPRLRRDVDTWPDALCAAGLGVGAQTSAILAPLLAAAASEPLDDAVTP